MEDFERYSNIQEHRSGRRDLWGYFVVRVIESALPISVFSLVILFGITGLFCLDEGTARTWALESAKCCLCVFIGLLIPKKPTE